MIYRGRLTQHYEGWELFGLLTAAICHDANHDGLDNAYHRRAETPLGILYKGQSISEIHHIHQSLAVITRPDIDLFAGFHGAALRQLWELFITLILATDMSRTFDIVAKATEAVDCGYYDFEEPSQHRVGLELVLQAANISNISRPFAFATQWHDNLVKEFYRQGDLEKAAGLEFSSPFMNRENTNKARSQLGFYTIVGIPLFTVLAEVFPQLKVHANAVRTNFETWQNLSENPE
jgi:hypothetical protein